MLCNSAMTIIYKQKLCAYNYCCPHFKVQVQLLVYMNVIHPKETHNMTIVNDKTSKVVCGQYLDNDHN